MARRFATSYAEVHKTLANDVERSAQRYSVVHSPVPRDFDPGAAAMADAQRSWRFCDADGAAQPNRSRRFSRSPPRTFGDMRTRTQQDEIEQLANLQYDADAGDHGAAPHSMRNAVKYSPRTVSVMRSRTHRFQSEREQASAERNPRGAAAFRRRVANLEYDYGCASPLAASAVESSHSFMGMQREPHATPYWAHSHRHPFFAPREGKPLFARPARATVSRPAPSPSPSPSSPLPLPVPHTRPSANISAESTAECATVSDTNHAARFVRDSLKVLRAHNPCNPSRAGFVAPRNFKVVVGAARPRSAPPEQERSGGPQQRQRERRSTGPKCITHAARAPIVSLRRQLNRCTPYVRWHVRHGHMDDLLQTWDDSRLRRARAAARKRASRKEDHTPGAP